jgi:archaeosine-15-forming tRNA-guanine transglycosylase
VTEHIIQASPVGINDGEIVIFDDENGFLAIEGDDGFTTLSKEAAKKLSKILSDWAKS